MTKPSNSQSDWRDRLSAAMVSGDRNAAAAILNEAVGKHPEYYVSLAYQLIWAQRQAEALIAAQKAVAYCESFESMKVLTSAQFVNGDIVGAKRSARIALAHWESEALEGSMIPSVLGMALGVVRGVVRVLPLRKAVKTALNTALGDTKKENQEWVDWARVFSNDE